MGKPEQAERLNYQIPSFLHILSLPLGPIQSQLPPLEAIRLPSMPTQILVLTYGSLDAVACLLKCLSKTIYCFYGQF